MPGKGKSPTAGDPPETAACGHHPEGIDGKGTPREEGNCKGTYMFR